MSLDVTLIKRLGSLRAADDQSAEIVAMLSDGEVVRAELTRPSKRSVRHHRMFFALMQIAAEHTGWSIEQVLVWAKIATGHCDVVTDREGEVTYIPKSISFAKMDQTQFNAFFERATAAVQERLLPDGTDRNELVDEVSARSGVQQAA